MYAASPLGKLSRQRLKGHLLLLTTPPDVNHPLLRTQAIFHLPLPPLPGASPFGPPGHFPQRGQHSLGTVAQATDARGVPSGEAVAPATEGASALADDPARCKPSSFAYSSHLSPFSTPIACSFPFRPSGPLPPKGTAQKGPPKLLFGGPEALPWAIICCCSVRQRRYPGSWHIRRRGQRG